MITKDGLEEISEAIASSVGYANLMIGTKIVPVPLHKTSIEDNLVNFYFLVGEKDYGEMTKFEVISTNGKVMATKPISMTKRSDGGIIVRFSISIKSE